MLRLQRNRRPREVPAAVPPAQLAAHLAPWPGLRHQVFTEPRATLLSPHRRGRFRADPQHRPRRRRLPRRKTRQRNRHANQRTVARLAPQLAPGHPSDRRLSGLQHGQVPARCLLHSRDVGLVPESGMPRRPVSAPGPGGYRSPRPESASRLPSRRRPARAPLRHPHANSARLALRRVTAVFAADRVLVSAVRSPYDGRQSRPCHVSPPRDLVPRPVTFARTPEADAALDRRRMRRSGAVASRDPGLPPSHRLVARR